MSNAGLEDRIFANSIPAHHFPASSLASSKLAMNQQETRPDDS
jgi:hypothetical protein